ncbi:MAG: T9SS type A sorting domain-containing protein [Bacteroidota bacterium]|nr:T9SS type A sorting domain-containing protein [Bacteroidota bacterium]
MNFLRNSILSALLVIFTISAQAQTYNMSTTTVTTCSGTFYDAGGSAGNYGNNENYTMTFTSSTGDRISFAFSTLSVEACCDRLYIYDGPTSAYPLIGSYATNPGTIVSSGASLTFRFTSNNNTTGAGWAANISCTTPPLTQYPLAPGTITACSGTVYDNGGPATNYSDGANITQTFTSGSSSFLAFSFLASANAFSASDTLFIYDGANTSAPLIAAHTAGCIMESFTSSGSSVTFRFISNVSGNNIGWAGEFQCTTIPGPPPSIIMAGGIRGMCSGTFYDVGGPTGNYGNSTNITQTLVSNNGNRLTVTFNTFALEVCCDRLYIYDGPTPNHPLIGAYGTNPGTITSTGTSLCFRFISDAATVAAGWDANVSCSTPALTAYPLSPGTVTACSGVVYDNGGATGNYSDGANITQTFTSGTAAFLQFTFLPLANAFSTSDTLFIYDGATTGAPLIAAHTALSTMESFTSSGSSVTFLFKSNASGNNVGWAGQFQCTTTPAAPLSFDMSSGIRSICSGNYYDAGGAAGNYGNSSNLTQTLKSSNGNRLSITFNTFLIEICCDRLYIYDGPNATYPLIGIYTTNPGTITSTGTSLTFRFTSDAVNVGFGWSANVNCTTPPLTVYPLTNGTVTACSGAIFDNGGATANYTDNATITQTFTSGTSAFLRFSFLNATTNFATGDTLFIYDGATTSAPLIAAHIAGTFMETFTSGGNSVTFRFKSNASGNSAGWAGQFECTTTPGAPLSFDMSTGIRGICSGNFFDVGGAAGNYGNSTDITQTLLSTNGNRLSITFNSFVLETCCDRLYIYDGPNLSYPLIGSYATNPGTITSTGTSLTFRFISDAATVAAGWDAVVNCTTPALTVYPLTNGTVTACSGAIFDNGGATANYTDNAAITQTFTSGTSAFLRFSFLNATTNFATGDTLFIYDGATSSAPLIAAHIAGTFMETFTSGGNSVTFRFKSNASGNSAGWAGQFECTTTPGAPLAFDMTAGIRGVCSGSLYDVGGPAGNYGNNSNITQTYLSNNGNRLSVTFNTFLIEICCDRLYIYDGPNATYPLIGIYTTNPGTITSTGTSLTFRFTSDAVNVGFGWSASISCTTPPLAVYPLTNGTVTACSGTVYDNGGPTANYTDNATITQTFTSGTSAFLRFSFLNATTNFATGDTLFIYDGPTTSATLIAAHVAGTEMETFTSTGNSVTFRFKSNASTNAPGWAGQFECTTTPGVPTFSMSAGIRGVCNAAFYDVGGPAGNYGNFTNQAQTFISNTGERLSITFTSMSIETCCDRLYIYDGPTTAYPLLGSYTANPGTVTSSGTSLTFVFTSDANTVLSGWAGNFACAGPVLNVYTQMSGTVSVCSGVYYDTGGPAGNYPDNENRTVTFCSATNQYLRFDFNPNHFNMAAGDSLFVYDGSSISAPLFAIFTGNTQPGPITSNTSCFTFRFKSNATTNEVGWQAWITCVSAPDPNPAISMTAGVRYTCGGTFYDSGGASAGYPNNENRTMVFYSNSGCGIRFTFTAFVTESCCDRLYVYDGPSTASPLIGTYAGAALPPVLQSSGSALTFRFQSDASSVGSGWAANISCPNQPLATVTAGGPTTICTGDSVTLTVNNNTSYLWNTGATTPGITVGAAGGYWVTVTNAGGCMTTSAITNVTVIPVPVASITAGGPATFCAGGSVTLTASGGNTYLWSNGATTSSITVTTSGTYNVTATNGSGCTDAATPVTVTVNPLPGANISASGPLNFCIGGNVTLTASGGGTYLWSNGATTSGINVTAAGSFNVTATSAAGCTATSSTVNVTVDPQPTASITAGGPLTFCSGGSVTLTASGGSSYLWSNGATSSSITVSSSGNFTVTSYSVNGNCSITSASTTVTVNPTPTPAISASGPLTFCSGGNVTLTASGGNTYLWSNGATTTSINVTASGNFSVTATGVNGCSATSGTVTVSVDPTPVANVSASGPTSFCQGGSVTLTASGGSTYLWSNGSTSTSIVVTASGNYSVTAYSSNGNCAGSSSITAVTVYPPPTPAITPSGPTTFCAGGSVTLTASGGSTYLWSDGSTTTSIVVTQTGNYSVTATGPGGCTAVSSVMSVTADPTPSASITASGPTTFCAGNNVVLTANGGNSYLWSNGQTSQSITPAISGNYSVIAYSSNFNCTDTSSVIAVTINPTPSPVINASGPTLFCSGGSVTLTATGGGTYLWSTGSTASAIAVTTGGSYSVNATNAFGCTGTSNTIVVTVDPTPVASITASGPVSFCAGDNVVLTANGGSSYLWSNGSTASSINVTTSGSYSVIAYSGNGNCSDTSPTTTVTVNPLPNVTLNLPQDTFCVTGNTTVLTGGSPAGGQYSGWGVTNGVFDPMQSGLGDIEIIYDYTDVNGCGASVSQWVYVDICMGIDPGTTNAGVTLYPNPATDRAMVQWPAAADVQLVTLTDATGRVLQTLTPDGTQLEIDLHGLAAGVYLVRLEGVQPHTLRLVKQ